jgi:predicted component of viral defense system (DUF524 family)
MLKVKSNGHVIQVYEMKKTKFVKLEEVTEIKSLHPYTGIVCNGEVEQRRTQWKPCVPSQLLLNAHRNHEQLYIYLSTQLQ